GAAAPMLAARWAAVAARWFARGVLSRVAKALGPLARRLTVRRLSPYCRRFLRRGSGGEWDFDLAWKPFDGFPARAGFLRAVRIGAEAVRAGLDIACPVLICCSAPGGASDSF